VLAALQAERGAEIQFNAVSAVQESGDDAVEALMLALQGEAVHPALAPYAEDLSSAAEEWQYLDHSVPELVPLLCRMGLQPYHVTHIFNRTERDKH
jgi:hypothetical protein